VAGGKEPSQKREYILGFDIIKNQHRVVFSRYCFAPIFPIKKVFATCDLSGSQQHQLFALDTHHAVLLHSRYNLSII
jgi:hypothetical protein